MFNDDIFLVTAWRQRLRHVNWKSFSLFPEHGEPLLCSSCLMNTISSGRKVATFMFNDDSSLLKAWRQRLRHVHHVKWKSFCLFPPHGEPLLCSSCLMNTISSGRKVAMFMFNDNSSLVKAWRQCFRHAHHVNWKSFSLFPPHGEPLLCSSCLLIIISLEPSHSRTQIANEAGSL